MKDFIPPKTASSVCVPGFPCSWFSRGRQDLGQTVRACTVSVCPGEDTELGGTQDSNSQQCASLFFLRRETVPHPSRFLADDTTLRNG